MSDYRYKRKHKNIIDNLQEIGIDYYRTPESDFKKMLPSRVYWQLLHNGIKTLHDLKTKPIIFDHYNNFGKKSQEQLKNILQELNILRSEKHE